MAHEHRLILIVPIAQVNTINTWIRNNLDSVGANWLIPNLSASGNAPATHAWFNSALTPGELRLIITRLCTVASISLPANWDSRNRAQKRTFIKNNLAPVIQGLNWRITEADNDGQWDDAETFLSSAGLQVISAN